MPVKSSGQLSLVTDIVTEFGGATNPARLSRYYAGGAQVPAGTIGYPGGVATAIPTSGRLNFSNFFGATRQVTYNLNTNPGNIANLILPAGTWYVYTRAVGGGGGGGGGSSGVWGTAGGSGGSFTAKYVINASQSGILFLTRGSGGGPGGRESLASGYAGRGSHWGPPTNTTSNFFKVETRVGYGNPTFADEAVWSTAFDSLGLNSRVAVSFYVDTSTTYTVSGGCDNLMNLFLDSTSNFIGSFNDFNNPGATSVFLFQGWHVLYVAGQNTGGPRGAFFRVTRQSDGAVIMSSKHVVSGGPNSGGFAFLNGGEGGNAGGQVQPIDSYTSGPNGGSGGGGGGASAIIWYGDTNSNGTNYSILGIAPGGGGGAGTGANVIPTNIGVPYTANWDNRGVTTNISVIGSYPAGNSGWNARGEGSRVPYSTNFFLKGQSPSNVSEFYPTSGQYDNGTTVDWYGGAGGGGGAPSGYPGGYAESPGNLWSAAGGKKSPTYWYPPNGSSGGGGNQGYHFQNLSFVSSYNFSFDNSLYNTYGGGGSNSYSSPTAGNTGNIIARITNVDDGIYPTP